MTQHVDTSGGFEPATPEEVAAIFAGCGVPWWIAGGYAIEFAVGRPLRAHDDIDVLMLRRYQSQARTVLATWDLWAADPPGTLRPWRPNEWLPGAVHDVWCRPKPDAPWRLQIMFDESDGDVWFSRRNPDVRRPLEVVGRVGPQGIPYIAPEIQFFYKAKEPRPKDESDFQVVVPELDSSQRRWLREAIRRTYGPGHAWLEQLDMAD
jgi:hypothetical protein